MSDDNNCKNNIIIQHMHAEWNQPLPLSNMKTPAHSKYYSVIIIDRSLLTLITNTEYNCCLLAHDIVSDYSRLASIINAKQAQLTARLPSQTPVYEAQLTEACDQNPQRMRN